MALQSRKFWPWQAKRHCFRIHSGIFWLLKAVGNVENYPFCTQFSHIEMYIMDAQHPPWQEQQQQQLGIFIIDLNALSELLQQQHLNEWLESAHFYRNSHYILRGNGFLHDYYFIKLTPLAAHYITCPSHIIQDSELLMDTTPLPSERFTSYSTKYDKSSWHRQQDHPTLSVSLSLSYW